MRLSRTSLQITLIGLLGASVLTACKVGPDFHTPQAPKVNGYTSTPQPTKTIAADGNAQTFISDQDIPAQWWTLFHSEPLNQLIQTGLANSPNLASAQAALRQAQQNLYAGEGNLLFPSVNAQYTGERQRYASPASNVTNSGSPVYNAFNASVNVSYTFDIFGGNRRQIESLAAQVDYQNYQLQASYITLTTNIVTTAITVASQQAQIEATQQLIQAQQRQLAITQKQLQLGGAATSDVLSQQSQLAQTEASLPPLMKSLAQSQDALAVLVGAFPANAQLPDIKLNSLTLPTQLPLSLPSKLVQQRPDVKASEALLHAASANVGVAIANMLPQFTINSAYGWTAKTAGALFGPSTKVWDLSGNLLQPVFHGGALQAQRRAAVAAYDQAEAQYKQTVLQAFQNVADTLRALEADAQSVQAQEQAESAAKATLDMTRKQLNLGGVSYLSLLNAQKQYQQAVINRIQAQALRYNDTAALFQALGGGWWNAQQQAGDKK